MSQGDKHSILIVDDQEALRDILVQFIRQAGFEPIEAQDGQQAIEIFRVYRPRVVLTDLMMPQMDGLTLLNEIRRIDRQAAVILMTGFGSEDVLIEALRGGAVNYFRKPFDFREIVAAVRNIVQYREEMGPSSCFSPALQHEAKRFTTPTRDADLLPIINQITLHLGNFLPRSQILNLKVGLEEMLKNALEHGNLAIPAEEKSRALEQGRFGELLRERLDRQGFGERQIHVESTLSRAGFRVTVRDEGQGFNWRALPDPAPGNLLTYSGRGIFLTRIYYDEVVYNDRGNEVTLIKRAERPTETSSSPDTPPAGPYSRGNPTSSV